MHLSSTVFTFNKPGKDKGFILFGSFHAKSRKVTATTSTRVKFNYYYSRFRVQHVIFLLFKLLFWYHAAQQQKEKTTRFKFGPVMKPHKNVCCEMILRWCSGLVTYVCVCAGSSPRVTLLPWISLKHFSQKWYLWATRPYLSQRYFCINSLGTYGDTILLLKQHNSYKVSVIASSCNNWMVLH